VLVIVAAMRDEVSGLLKRGLWQAETRHGIRTWRSGERYTTALVAVVGVGRQAAKEAADRLLAAERATALMSVGFAGGLDPTLRPGDVVLAERIQAWRPGAGGTRSIVPEASLLGWAEHVAGARGLRIRKGGWLTVESAVTSPEEKGRLWQEMGAVAVEMESYWLGEAAERAGVPFLAVRTILDTARAALPRAVRTTTRTPSAASVAAALIRRPQEVPAVLGLARSMALARRNLTLFVGTFWSEFAERTAPSPAPSPKGRGT
jgi:adenosylhomocysteine nucleosidase